MNRILNFITFCASLMLLVGCASHPSSREQDTPRQLTHWIDKQLVPYVVKQLSQHPKFKNQPFLVVGMKGDNIQSDIDDLTHYIRNRLMAALLQTPGVNPLWRPATRPWKHHRYLADLSCGEFSQARYYLGVDIQVSPLDKTMEVSIQALDAQQNNWVSGFYQSWQGQLNPAQQDALARHHQDEYLRGLRPLPFTASQPDLLASYLAHNVSCLLRHSQTNDEVLIYAQHPTTEVHPYFRTALDLVDNYLGRFREVHITGDPQQARVILESQVYYLHDHLYQVWVTLREAQGSHHLPGTETEAYVRLPETPPSRSHPSTPLPKPEIPPASSTGVVAPSAAANPNLIPQHQVKLTRRSSTFIDSLRFLMTQNQVNCTTERWRFREGEAVRLEDLLTHSPCLIMEVSVNKPLRLLIIGQNSQGELSWIIPSPCEGNQAAGIFLKAGETFHYPLPHQKKKIQIKDFYNMPGTGWIYVIAMVDQELSRNPHQRARSIATRLGLCKNQQVSFSSWKIYLNQLLVENDQLVEWKTVPFPSCQANQCIYEVQP
ncbi:hypothetical protein Nhal_1526 [Nitrosococcus halophilus Nc 4]|uniref:Uncharacterized protein n=2 Tax=Nitrosococcus halophilus TaxID=133539 RepID=D5C1N4_NITHN|nr:hypothetical protein Nhal_1526 [Nitrosococcus halophilus Nc 4]